MKKHILSLFILTLMALPGLSLGETMTTQQTKDSFKASQFSEVKEVETDESSSALKGDVALPQTGVVEPPSEDSQPTIKLEQVQITSFAQKCGVNSFSIVYNSIRIFVFNYFILFVNEVFIDFGRISGKFNISKHFP